LAVWQAAYDGYQAITARIHALLDAGASADAQTERAVAAVRDLKVRRHRRPAVRPHDDAVGREVGGHQTNAGSTLGKVRHDLLGTMYAATGAATVALAVLEPQPGDT
jgi:hypothetical protein